MRWWQQCAWRAELRTFGSCWCSQKGWAHDDIIGVSFVRLARWPSLLCYRFLFSFFSSTDAGVYQQPILLCTTDSRPIFEYKIHMVHIWAMGRVKRAHIFINSKREYSVLVLCFALITPYQSLSLCLLVSNFRFIFLWKILSSIRLTTGKCQSSIRSHCCCCVIPPTYSQKGKMHLGYT